MQLSPEMSQVAGADAFVGAEGTIMTGARAEPVVVPPGSMIRARSRRSFRNLGGPHDSAARRYRRSEIHEEEREGRGDVGASRSTCEAGEADRATPWREGDAGRANRWRER